MLLAGGVTVLVILHRAVRWAPILSQWLLLVIEIPVVVKLLGGFTFPWLSIMFAYTCKIDVMSQPFCNQDV